MAETNIHEIQEISVEERLKSLYRLQEVMSEIDKIKTLRGDLPLEVQDLEDEIAGLNTRVQRNTEEITERKHKIAENKNAIEEARLKIGKKTEQQGQVVNNREYEILSKEIENLNLDIQIFEKNISDFNVDTKYKQEANDELKIKIDDKKIDLKQKKQELNAIIHETKQEEEQLRNESKQLENMIDTRLLAAFKRIRKNARNGLAVVAVERDACSGCFSKIPPQRQLDIRQRKKIIVCENCGRILVDHDMSVEVGTHKKTLLESLQR
ncbi:MAG: C4-type zinc ribbon domain-containing protein [Prevotellaceae bacterium]|jgi:predicted  nucleic acid-binding Zn-ribbon protein|nr:C4-type zinc ribbon domain-containing protein [Prevotellaceae bacterium]